MISFICSSTLRSRSRSGLYLSDDYNSPRMNRSRSMSRLHLNNSQEIDPGLSSSLRQRPFEFSLRHLKGNLDDSENRRIVLVHKLKEAQETLEVDYCCNGDQHLYRYRYRYRERLQTLTGPTPIHI